MALQLNEDPDWYDVNPVKIRKEKEAYKTFRPQIEVYLKRYDGEEEECIIKYNTLKDFGKNEIISRTPILKELAYQRVLYGNLSQILSNDKKLKEVLSNPQQKKELLKFFSFIIEELEDSKPWENQKYPLIKAKLELLKELKLLKRVSKLIKTKGLRELLTDNEMRRNIFLYDEDKKERRDKIKDELNAIKEMLSQSDELSKIIENSRIKSKEVDNILNENLKKIFRQLREFERGYLMLNSFFLNTNASELDYLLVMNMAIEEFSDDRNYELYESLHKYFGERFERFNLSRSIDYLVLPGYLEDRLDLWSKMANKYMITLVTDYKDLYDIDSFKR